MAVTIPYLEIGSRGVDMRANPFFVSGARKLAYAENVSFEEGGIFTRYGLKYHNLGLAGRLQDARVANLGKGISRGQYGYDTDVLVIVIGGRAYYVMSQIGYEGGDKTVTFCDPVRICDLEWGCDECVRIGQVENYVVFYGGGIKTHIWDGVDCWESKGMQGFCDDVEEETFCTDSVSNEIPHNICHLSYVHARAHAARERTIYIGDEVHRRSEEDTKDAYKFSQQVDDSYGDPIGIPSRMGRYHALEIYPSMGSTYGEGDLIGYTSSGIVRHDTYVKPRQNRYDGAGGLIQKGWGYQQMVSHVANTVTATGYNAVTVTPRDHFFASDYGVHFLSQIVGEGSLNDESTRTISQDIDPMYRWDSPALTHGRSTGHWIDGNRYFVTIGHFESQNATLPMAKGYASFNQAITFTEDRTPIPAWEGLHKPDDEVSIHKFTASSLRPAHGVYGFLASTDDGVLYFAEMVEGQEHDTRDGEEIPIEWELMTGQNIYNGLKKTATIDDATIQYVTGDADLEISVMIRTSNQCEWETWRTLTPCVDKIDKDGRTLNIKALGKPPKEYRDGAWFQVKIQGKGYAELSKMDIHFSDGEEIKGQAANYCKCAGDKHRDWKPCFDIEDGIIYAKKCVCGQSLKKDEPCNCINE